MLLGVAVIIVAGLGLSVLLGINPLLEGRLRTQFGDHFFSDFGIAKPVEASSDLESIIHNYEPIFISLQDEAMDRLDSLVDQALEEYRQQERTGTMDQFTLTNKYIQAGRMLERGVDEVFYDLLEDMKQELTYNGYSTDLAADVEATYLAAKEAKKMELLDRLHHQIGQ